MNHTLDYYNQNAQNFIENTLQADMHPTQDKFLDLLPSDACILDFGCGSGRDTKYFLDKGCRVTATDGSARLVELAGSYTGIPVKRMLFQELDEVDIYDGIWACSSILHLPRVELLPVLRKMCTALKPGGIIYTSFKYGDFEGERNGRYFTDFTEGGFRDFAKPVLELSIMEYWITGDVRPGRENEKWLNLLMKKR